MLYLVIAYQLWVSQVDVHIDFNFDFWHKAEMYGKNQAVS